MSNILDDQNDFSKYKELLVEAINDTVNFCIDFFNSTKSKNLLITEDKNGVIKIFEEYLSMTFTNMIAKKNKLENSMSEIRLKWVDEYEYFPFHINGTKNWNNIEIDSISNYNKEYILTEIKIADKFYYGKHKSDIGRLCYLLQKSNDISWCNFIIFDIKNINDLNGLTSSINIVEKTITDFININDNTDIFSMQAAIQETNHKIAAQENSKIKVIIIKKDSTTDNESKLMESLAEDMFYGNVYKICLENIQSSIDNLETLIFPDKYKFLNFHSWEDIKTLKEDREAIIKTSNDIFAPNVLKSNVLKKIFSSLKFFDEITKGYSDMLKDYNEDNEKYENNARKIFQIIYEAKVPGLNKLTTRRADILVFLINKLFLDLELKPEENDLFEELKKLLNLNKENITNEDEAMKQLAFLAIYYLKKINEVDEDGILSQINKWDDSVDEELNIIYSNFISYLYIENIDYENTKTKNTKFPDLDRDMKKCKTFIDDLHNKISYFKKNNIKISTNEDPIPNYIFYYKIIHPDKFIKSSKKIDKEIKEFREKLKRQIIEFNDEDTKQILKDIEELFENELNRQK